ncbi:hypothetical protein A2397_04160 [Candidatus Amesbacteria bacterium RIFOXYB1_FULL_44_23]|uniref:Glycosyltransferase 2-like domain-containing protein n=1 Tax=Candidatus Amesbacteria bacterium RIFOXYB1_FULL_44_23 TaxID=1797263 RepID=A0A1F4ZQV7_9BACT|nr:MAG: hypothetical protein A2397_04160 [Candidatus Amesbacteria bacterium RIFOXYB1_FULL_44_23]
MTVSVVIPAYNGSQYLKKNLPAVLKLGADEIIVVDDASTDDSVSVIESFKSIKLIKNSVNLRFPTAANIGFNHASGEIVVLINQDVTPDADLITRTLPYFKNPRLFAVSFNEQGNSWADVKFTAGLLQYSNGAKTRHPHSSFWASGGSAAFRKNIWDKLGGFNTIFTPGYYEDLDLGWRARKQGYEILWAPDAKVDHVRETAYSKAFNKDYLTKIKERNYLLCHWMNLDPALLMEHWKALFVTCLKTPGYSVPVLMALSKISQVITTRRKLKLNWTQTDAQVFSPFLTKTGQTSD